METATTMCPCFRSGKTGRGPILTILAAAAAVPGDADVTF